ncbi:hypothetical protein [Neisseria sp.]|uniref:hypothetical protein n=1 Tax=Neisseria sp. TaxID=192066 RepID=UPI0035A12816
MENTETLAEFIRSYDGWHELICFDWNGGSAETFSDGNADFRRLVLGYAPAKPETVPPQLWRDLFAAEAAWSAKAWCAFRFFPELAAHFLNACGAAELETFSDACTLHSTPAPPIII